ncbi:hypothetical protein ZIOFF_029176 [Zingiber officinale]|uniref:Uncharacterized protein n=1 Tax=Zingiber officinale TaxID=94328 RepID=A0A8J5LE98_ZINOF|nr:hypothetical protein ZIOFF_029176 [Zingiber officinale]
MAAVPWGDGGGYPEASAAALAATIGCGGCRKERGQRLSLEATPLAGVGGSDGKLRWPLVEVSMPPGAPAVVSIAAGGGVSIISLNGAESSTGRLGVGGRRNAPVDCAASVGQRPNARLLAVRAIDHLALHQLPRREFHVPDVDVLLAAGGDDAGAGAVPLPHSRRRHCAARLPPQPDAGLHSPRRLPDQLLHRPPLPRSASIRFTAPVPAGAPGEAPALAPSATAPTPTSGGGVPAVDFTPSVRNAGAPSQGSGSKTPPPQASTASSFYRVAPALFFVIIAAVALHALI